MVAGFLLQVEKSKAVVHESDEPNALVDFLDADFLAGESGRGLILLRCTDEQVAIVERRSKAND